MPFFGNIILRRAAIENRWEEINLITYALNIELDATVTQHHSQIIVS